MRRSMRSLAIGLIGVTLLAPPWARVASASLAAACDVPHRSVAAIVEAAIGADPNATLPGPTPYAPAFGSPADAATTERVQEAVRALVGCANVGDVAGFLSLMSDDFLGRYGASLGFSAADIAQGRVEPLSVGEQVMVREIRDVVVRNDGRIDALVLLDQGERTRPELTSVMTFVEDDGRLLLDALTPVTLGEARAAWAVVAGDGYTGAVVGAADVVGFVHGLTGIAVQGAWLPTADQIAVLEAKLPAALVAEAAGRATLRPVGDYLRQYAGFVAGGRALLLVNGFCDPAGADWRREPVFVMDGGACYVHATYDMAAGTFTRVAINGEA